MEVEQIRGFKNTLTSSVPIVETVTLEPSVDVSKIKKQCQRCHKLRVTRPYSTPLVTESNPTGMHWLCRECAKPVRIELRNYSNPLSKMKVVEFFQELTVPQVFQVSVDSPALKGWDKSWYVELRKKFHMELTKEKALFAVWVDSHAV